MRQAVRRADDEVVERVAAVQVDGVAGGRCRRQRLEVAVGVDLDGHGARCIRDDELDRHRVPDHAGQGLADEGAVAVVEPVAGEAVGGSDAEAIVLVDLDELCVLQPRVEIRRGKADLQLAESGAPYLLRFHQQAVSTICGRTALPGRGTTRAGENRSRRGVRPQGSGQCSSGDSAAAMRIRIGPRPAFPAAGFDRAPDPPLESARKRTMPCTARGEAGEGQPLVCLSAPLADPRSMFTLRQAR